MLDEQTLALQAALAEGDLAKVRALIDAGADLEQTDEIGNTDLVTAVQFDNLEAVDMLLRAGADVNNPSSDPSALWHASSREVALRLLEAGADPQELSQEARRAILGYSPELDEGLSRVSAEEFRRWRARRFGRHNPERMNNPFWEAMIHTGMNAYWAVYHVLGQDPESLQEHPVWCAQRFGQSLTFLPDDRIVQVAGEHEDHYDPDFCIYNDVFVHSPDGDVTIYGYPESVFPPTDFHTATLIGDSIYIIGSLGYKGSRQHGTTPVYRLNTNTFRMEGLAATGEAPGWIHEHRAVLSGDAEICVTGGKVLTVVDGREVIVENAATFTLNTDSLVWTQASALTLHLGRAGAPARARRA